MRHDEFSYLLTALLMAYAVAAPVMAYLRMRTDHIGRENAMFTAFLIEGLAIWAWLHTIHRPVMFVLLSSLVFFAWGEIFSLFPSITADLFGRRWATTNYGLVYTSKGTASIFAHQWPPS